MEKDYGFISTETLIEGVGNGIEGARDITNGDGGSAM